MRTYLPVPWWSVRTSSPSQHFFISLTFLFPPAVGAGGNPILENFSDIGGVENDFDHAAQSLGILSHQQSNRVQKANFAKLHPVMCSMYIIRDFASGAILRFPWVQ